MKPAFCQFLPCLALLLGVALTTTGCYGPRGGCCASPGTYGGKPGPTVAEMRRINPAEFNDAAAMAAALGASELQILLVESFTITPGVTQYDGAGNPPNPYLMIELVGRPGGQGHTVTRALLRFLPETWGKLGQATYIPARNEIWADFPREQAADFYQVLKDGKRVLCFFSRSATSAKTDCYLYVSTPK
jgi:hypothetical protein